MANNTEALKTELLNLLTTTTNLDSATKTLLRNSFVTDNPVAWLAFLAAGNTDTAGNRAIFAIERTFQYWRDTVRSGSNKSNIAALPAPSDIT